MPTPKKVTTNPGTALKARPSESSSPAQSCPSVPSSSECPTHARYPASQPVSTRTEQVGTRTNSVKRPVEPVARKVLLGVVRLVRTPAKVRERLARSCVDFSDMVIDKSLQASVSEGRRQREEKETHVVGPTVRLAVELLHHTLDFEEVGAKSLEESDRKSVV